MTEHVHNRPHRDGAEDRMEAALQMGIYEDQGRGGLQ